MIISPKTHSTAVLTFFIDKLNNCCYAVTAAPLNGPCRRTLKGMQDQHTNVRAGQLELYSVLPTLAASQTLPVFHCLLPSSGPKRLAMRPLGATTLAWTRLCPLNNTRWCPPGLATGRTYSIDKSPAVINSGSFPVDRLRKIYNISLGQPWSV